MVSQVKETELDENLWTSMADYSEVRKEKSTYI